MERSGHRPKFNKFGRPPSVVAPISSPRLRRGADRGEASVNRRSRDTGVIPDIPSLIGAPIRCFAHPTGASPDPVKLSANWTGDALNPQRRRASARSIVPASAAPQKQTEAGIALKPLVELNSKRELSMGVP